MAVHFRISQADEWADKEEIKRDGRVFRAIRRLESDVIPQVDGLVYVSGWAQEALASWFPAALTVPSAVIPNFVAPLNGTAKQEQVADLVTVGNLDLVKNHRYLLQVLAAAKRAGRSFTLDVFGEGPQRTHLLQLIQSLGLEEQVRLRGFRRDVRNFLPGYRAYVHASYSESSSLAIIEAMAAGLPIVAGNIGPLGELFDEGVEGRFWPLDDATRAAEVLIRFVESEPERVRAGNAAEARFRRDFDAEGIAPQLLSFLMQAPPAADPGHPGGGPGRTILTQPGGNEL
jgi:glycosyltransferase involved in cell wall biosynthesis